MNGNEAPLACPGCRAPMRPLDAERKPQGEVRVDYCPDCQAIWFDTLESPSLAVGGVLALFRALGTAKPAEVRPLPSLMGCPRCAARLEETHDLQHATRFTYWRCPFRHGRLTPFVQFLREKDFIRPLGDDELARLKSAVRTIRCGGCGAPVDIERSTVCPYCRSPIVALDPDAVQRALAGTNAPAPGPQRAPDVDALVDALLAAREGADRAPQGAFPARIEGSPVVDLVGLGVAAFAHLWSR